MNQTMLRNLVQSILKAPTRHEWSLQGFGMLRTYLGDDVRLHVWDSEYRATNVTEAHTHPWDFESVVVAGKMVDEVYMFHERGSVGGEMWYEGLITCGPSPKDPSVRDVRRVPLMDRVSRTFLPGDSYWLSADTAHRSIPKDGTVTLIHRAQYKSDRDTARVYWPLDNVRVSAMPRVATATEVKAITGRALDRWF